jgi:biotin transport system substrate-specific component
MKIKTKDLVLTALFSSLMAAGAYVRIPFPYVPLTFQPFFCALSGIILGSRLAVLSQLVYIIAGLSGIPVFASGGGITYIYNPSFGFLTGFVLAAFIIGKLSEKIMEYNIKNIMLVLIPGLIAINLMGIPYFYLITNIYLKQPLTFYHISAIFLPYIIKDFVLYIIISIVSIRVIPILKNNNLLPCNANQA